MPASRAGQHGIQDDGAHGFEMTFEVKPASVVACVSFTEVALSGSKVTVAVLLSKSTFVELTPTGMTPVDLEVPRDGTEFRSATPRAARLDGDSVCLRRRIFAGLANGPRRGATDFGSIMRVVARRRSRGGQPRKSRQSTRRPPTPGSRRVRTIDFVAASPMRGEAVRKSSAPRPAGRTGSS